MKGPVGDGGGGQDRSHSIRTENRSLSSESVHMLVPSKHIGEGEPRIFI